jgi:hypothetical protein
MDYVKAQRAVLLIALVMTLMGLALKASAQELVVSNGGLLGIEGDYSANLTEANYGDTLFIKVQNVTAQEYAILIDGKSIGNDEVRYTITEEGGSITIETSPATNSITVNVTKPDGFAYYLAKYMIFAKSLPALSGTLFLDTVLWAVFIIPIASAICIKLLILAFRAIM